MLYNINATFFVNRKSFQNKHLKRCTVCIKKGWKAREQSTIKISAKYTYHNFFILSFADGHLGSFHILATVTVLL